MIKARRPTFRLGSRIVWATILGANALAQDLPLADFETDDYDAWTVEGEAFGSGPSAGALPAQMKVSGYAGDRLVNSYHGGDASTGRLLSPPFRIERPFINFLIGGGGFPGETCINLRLGDEVARTATGPNTRPGGSEELAWKTWDVRDLAGRQARIEIVDQRTGGWGHINVDQIVQSDRKREEGPATREVVVTRRYLHLPVKNGAKMRRLQFLVDGEAVRAFDIELAEAAPDFVVFADVSRWRGQRLKLRVDRLPEGSKGLVSIVQSDEVPDPASLYREKHRPQFHFSSRRGWNNDPNGLVFYRGEYHLFYQHNPYGWRWGNMHWGHAVSRDLVHWREIAIALHPWSDAVGHCFSGSAAVDWHNTSGFQSGEEPPIVAALTDTGAGESIAYSNDRGRTWTMYDGNPVVEHRGRDPKIFWYEPGKHWVMALYDEHEEKRWISFSSSPDLKEWRFESRIEGYYECPEIFELPVGDDPERTRWVVYAADGAYALGDFDGKVFTIESGKHRFNWGNCFYASQTYNDIPAADGRRIQIAWGRTGHDSMPFNQMMNFPVELTLRDTTEGIRMFAQPVRELTRLHDREHAWLDLRLAPEENPLAGLRGDLFDIRAVIRPGAASEVGFTIRGTPVVYDVRKQELRCGDQTAPLGLEEGRLDLTILVDRLSIEVFGNEGRVYLPMAFVPPEDDTSLSVFARGGSAQVEELRVFKLRSIWRR